MQEYEYEYECKYAYEYEYVFIHACIAINQKQQIEADRKDQVKSRDAYA